MVRIGSMKKGIKQLIILQENSANLFLKKLKKRRLDEKGVHWE